MNKPFGPFQDPAGARFRDMLQGLVIHHLPDLKRLMERLAPFRLEEAALHKLPSERSHDRRMAGMGQPLRQRGQLAKVKGARGGRWLKDYAARISDRKALRASSVTKESP